MTRCDRDGARRVIRPVGRSRAQILAVLADREILSERCDLLLDNAKKNLANVTGDVLLSTYEPGDRVELAPHTDAWARGDRYGEVTDVGRFYVHVTLDGSSKKIRVTPENLAGRLVVPTRLSEDGVAL